jgi:hypothetical protein
VLVAFGLKNACVLVWCGVTWLVQSSRSLHGTVWEEVPSQTMPCKDLVLWTNHHTPNHTSKHSFGK